MNPEQHHDTCQLIKLQAKHQKFNSRLIKLMVYFTFMALLIALYLVYFSLSFNYLFEETPFYVEIANVLLVYGIFFVLPSLICLPVILPLALNQKNVARIVVLRKFNDKKCARALSKIIKSNLANYGHVFTLSDSKFKEKWYIRFPMFLGQLSLFHFRHHKINKLSNVSRLKRKLDNYAWLNINWLLSNSKVFAVQTSDDHWRSTASALLENSDLIIFDVSYSSDSLDWELSEVRKLGFIPKMIAVSVKQHRWEAVNVENTFDFSDSNEIKKFYYNDNGNLLGKEAFDACVVDLLSRFYKDQDVFERSRSYALKRTLYTSALMIFIYLLSFFIICPYYMPYYVGMNSPFRYQVFTAYFKAIQLGDYYNFTKYEPQRIQYKQNLILQRLKRKWPEEAASTIFTYAYKHDVAECKAVSLMLWEFSNREKIDEYKKIVLNKTCETGETAFKIIQSIHTDEKEKIAFDFLLSPRMDVRAKAIQLLQNVPMSDDLTDKVLYTLDHTPLTRTEPKQELKNLNFFTKEKEFCKNLLKLLDSNINKAHIQKLQKLLHENKPPEISTVAAMLLAKMNDASGIPILSNTRFLREGYSIQDMFRKLLSKEPLYLNRADSSILAMNNPKNIPTMEKLLSSLNIKNLDTLSAGNPASESLIVFVLRNYNTSDFGALLSSIPGNNSMLLANAFYYSLNNNSNQSRIPILAFIELSKERLMPILSSENMENRLRVAWILAHVGEISVAKIALDAGMVHKPASGWMVNPTDEEKALFNKPAFTRPYSHPYSIEAENILTILYSSLKPPYDPKPFINLRSACYSYNEENPSKIIKYSHHEKILDKLIIKAKKRI